MSASVLQPPVKEPKRNLWQRIRGSKFLFVSIVIHLLFALGATIYVVQSFTAKRKLTFSSAPPSPNPSRRALEHQVQLAKKQAMSAPAQAKRIVTTGMAKFALPEMPAMAMNSESTPTKMAGMGGTGVGLGPSGGTGTGGGGGAMPFFGLRKQNGGALEGTFYDFRTQEDGRTPVQGINMKAYTEIVRDFVKGAWAPNAKFKHFISPTKLYASHFLFPAIESIEAGKAFKSPTSPDGIWIAHYKGFFAAPKGGRFRFVGFGDNVMIVRVDNTLVLDASDKGYSGHKRDPGGKSISFPKKANTPVFMGNWFQMDAGANKSIDVAVGDEGGIFCAGLFIQEQGIDYRQGEHNAPLLPLFSLSPLTEADKNALRKYLPEECLSGPVFTPKNSIFGDFRR